MNKSQQLLLAAVLSQAALLPLSGSASAVPSHARAQAQSQTSAQLQAQMCIRDRPHVFHNRNVPRGTFTPWFVGSVESNDDSGWRMLIWTSPGTGR